jgi:hypothetical protein
MTIRAISTVSEAYQRDKTIQPHFRPHGAMVYDACMCSFPRTDHVALLTLDGRIEVPYRSGAYAEEMLHRARGQADLLYRASSATFLLAMSVDAPAPTPAETHEFLGVDLGIIQLATTSDGEFLNSSTGPKHAHVNQVRARSSRFRSKLQKKGTKSERDEKRQTAFEEAQRTRAAVWERGEPLSPRSLEGACQHGARHPARDCAGRSAGDPHTRWENGYETPPERAAPLELLPTPRFHCLQGGIGWGARGLRQPGVYQPDL